MQGIKLNKLNNTKSNITMAGQTNNNLALHLAHPTTKFPTGTHWTCLSFLATSLIMIASSDCATRRVSCIKTPLITPMHAKPMVTCQPLQKVHVCIWCLKTGLKSAHVTARLCAFSLVWYCAIVSMLILGPFCLPVQIVGGSNYATWRLISFKASANITHIINKCAIHWPLLLYDKWIQNNTSEYNNIYILKYLYIYICICIYTYLYIISSPCCSILLLQNITIYHHDSIY